MGDPFADPSIQRVAQNLNTSQRALEDYNPFDGQQQDQVRPAPFGAQQPAVVPSNQSTVLPSGQLTAASPTSPAGVTQISTAELQVSVCNYSYLDY